MKFLEKINFDAKAIIQDLRDLNDSLINAVVEYQQTIFELKEQVEMQREEIERLQKNEQIATEVIKESSAEIERLTEENKKQKIILEGIEDAVHPLPFETDYDKAIKQAKSEAIREYVTKYKDYIKNHTGCFDPSIGFAVTLDSVLNAADFVADEMVGDE